MRKAVLILFVCGLGSLIIGSVLAIPSVGSRLAGVMIRSYGTVVNSDDSSSQTAGSPLPQETSLDKVGYFTILASIGFFATGIVISRKRN
jgi:hypothetical protein